MSASTASLPVLGSPLQTINGSPRTKISQRTNSDEKSTAPSGDDDDDDEDADADKADVGAVAAEKGREGEVEDDPSEGDLRMIADRAVPPPPPPSNPAAARLLAASAASASGPGVKSSVQSGVSGREAGNPSASSTAAAAAPFETVAARLLRRGGAPGRSDAVQACCERNGLGGCV